MTAQLLQFDVVSKSFWRGPRETRVLRELSLTVDAGEFLGIYGTRGVGKTALLRIAAGFDLPDSGTASFNGRDFASLSGDRRTQLHRNQIGWVERSGPQSRDLTMRDYVALPLYSSLGPVAAQRRALAELMRVGAGDVADQRWGDLSDTARMLVALAHALARGPQLLLADDPTAGLSVIDRERILGLLRSTAEDANLGVLMVVPDLPALNMAHTVLMLSRGRVLRPADRSPDGSGTVVEFPTGERSA